ncbi:MAG TPA: Gfo/Idh/MocA family oxidoreductase [Limnochordia bacterium]
MSRRRPELAGGRRAERNLLLARSYAQEVDTIASHPTAIVGCGPRAAAHAAAYRHVTAGTLAACCDIDEERLHRFGDRFGIERRYTDVTAMLSEVQPHLVHLVTSPTVRWSVIEPILATRPPALLVEKPLANRPSEGYRILDACRSAGTLLFVNHQLRHHRPFIALHDAIRSGKLGRIEWVRASCRGNLLEQGTHLFDLISALFDDAGAEWIFAQAEGAAGYEGPHSAPAYTVGAIRLAGGVHVGFECGALAPTWRNEPNFWLNKGIEVVGTEGRAGSSTNHGWWVQTKSGLQAESVPYDQEDDRAQGALIQSILTALDEPERVADHPNNAERSQISFDWVMAAQRSALRRQRVPLGLERVADQEIEALKAALQSSE